MNRKRTKVVLILVVLLGLAATGIALYLNNSISIKSIELSSPGNYAMNEDVKVKLNATAALYIRYWKEGSGEIFRTATTGKAMEHTVRLLLLQPDATYHYEVVIDKLVNASSKTFSFHTRKQSPWLIHNWVKEDNPHDAGALGNGMVMLCNARLPGYIAMVDGKGSVRWYWQTDDIGVRAATITPRGTILAMLRPPMKDVIDDTPKEEADSLREMEKPIRRGAMGFAGGTAIAEIDLNGNQLWRINMDTVLGVNTRSYTMM